MGIVVLVLYGRPCRVSIPVEDARFAAKPEKRGEPAERILGSESRLASYR